MLKAETVAKYFLAKDPDRKIFNNNIIVYNNIKFYEGNARLNKYLFLAQVVYLAKYEKRLFKDDFKAYANGPVIEKIMNEYGMLAIADGNEIKEEIKIYLDKIYESLKNATCIELIEITHEDPEWLKNSNNVFKAPKMDLENSIAEYKKRYKGLIEALKL